MTDIGNDPDELDTRIMRSSAWAVLGFGGTNALSLVTTIVLARLLDPEDFGLVALTLAVLAVAYLAQESGLGAALVVHRGELRAGGCFGGDLLAGRRARASTRLAFVAAPFFADVFDEPELVDVLRVTALVLVIRGFTIMPLALLQRQMRFGPITAIELSGGVAQAIDGDRARARGRRGVEPRLRPARLRRRAARARLVVLADPAFAAGGAPGHAPRADALRAPRRPGEHHQLRQQELRGPHRRPRPRRRAARLLHAVRAARRDARAGDRERPRARRLRRARRGSRTTRPRSAASGSRTCSGWRCSRSRPRSGSCSWRIRSSPPCSGRRWEPGIAALQILALNGIVRTFSTTSGEVFQALRRPQLQVYTEASHLALIVPALFVGAKWQGIEGAAAAVVLVNVAIGVPVARSPHAPARRQRAASSARRSRGRPSGGR